MDHPFDLSSRLDNFSGRAPLFPLPNIAFFPHVLMPLHIFEPRYRQMTVDALETDRYIAMAQLKPGFDETAPFEEPEIFDVVCLGQIAAEERLGDGRYFLMLQGLARARVLSEESSDLPYRVGRLELLPDRAIIPSPIDRIARREQLVELFQSRFPKVDMSAILKAAVDPIVSLGLVCDVMASALGLPPEQTQEILAADDIDERSEIVLERLRETVGQPSAPGIHPNAPSGRPETFPPDFSLN